MPRETKKRRVPLEGMEIQPVGGISADVVEGVVALLREAFDCAVRTLAPRPVTCAGYEPARGQYDASTMVSAIRPDASKPGWKRLGVAEADLSGSTALVSLARLKDEYYWLPADGSLLAKRAAKETIHEMGHTLGPAHCPNRRCIMYFSDSLVDTDANASEFCPSCSRRLEGEEDK